MAHCAISASLSNIPAFSTRPIPPPALRCFEAAKDPSIEVLEYTARGADGGHDEPFNTTEVGSRGVRFGIAGQAGYSTGVAGRDGAECGGLLDLSSVRSILGAF